MASPDSIRRAFASIGADVRLVEVPRPRIRGGDVPDVELRVEHDRRAGLVFQVCVHGELASPVELKVACSDRRARMLVLDVMLPLRRATFLCAVQGRQGWARALPAHTPAGIAHARAAVAEEDARERERVEADANKQSQLTSPRKVARVSPVPTLAQARALVGLRKADHPFLVRLFEKCAKLKLLRDDRPVYPQYSDARENRFAFALMRMGAFAGRRRAEPEDWRPGTHNPLRQFHSLANHLFADYRVPPFMTSVWFRPEPDWIPWFLALGKGESIRKVEGFPAPLTKRMAHAMLHAPARLTVEEAIRWGEVVGIGGDERFFREIESTRIGSIEAMRRLSPDRHAFWQTVQAWLLRQPMLDPVHYGPIIDFIEYQKFAHPAPQPDFEIAGRTPRALLLRVGAWHGDLARSARMQKRDWLGHGMNWGWDEMENEEVHAHWEMRELLDNHALVAEGRAMHHCVYTYAGSCASGSSAIYSLTRDGRRVLTIEYQPQFRRIAQVRGAANRRPTPRELAIVRRWASDNGIGVAHG